MLGDRSLDDFFRAAIREAVREVARDAVKDAVKELVARAESEKDVFSAREAAEFVCMSYDAFKRVASTIERVQISEHRYVYLRKDLLAWLEARKSA
jgi:hypothetical protein